MNAFNRKAFAMTAFNHNDALQNTMKVLRMVVSWAIALGLGCAFVVWSVNAQAQTAPCSALKNCTIERDQAKQRLQLEHSGLPGDAAEALVGKGDSPRYLLRCWQQGQLIAERAVYTLPAESRSIKPLTDHTGSSVVAFDLKNAVCIAESQASENRGR
jgi:hypothetical protein